MPTHATPNDLRTVLQAYADAWQRGDIATLTQLYHDDFTLHYPGTHALAGIHRGKATALQVMRTVSERTNRKLLQIVDVMTGTQRGSLNVVEQWSRGGETVQVERVFVYTVRDGKLHQCWLFDTDQQVIAKLLSE